MWSIVAIALCLAKSRSRAQTSLLTKNVLDKRLSSFLRVHFWIQFGSFMASVPLIGCALALFFQCHIRLLHDGPWALLFSETDMVAAFVVVMGIGTCSLVVSAVSLDQLVMKVAARMPSYHGFEHFCALVNRHLGMGLMQRKGERFDNYVTRVGTSLRNIDPEKPLNSSKRNRQYPYAARATS